MDPSAVENTTNNISSRNSSNLTRTIIDEVKGAFGFFALSKDEMAQAGIIKGKFSTSNPQNDPELQSDSRILQDDQRI